MLSFYAEVFLRAIKAIPSSLGSNWLGLVWPMFVVFCGEILACRLYGLRAMIAKWKSASLIGLAALGSCYMLLFLWCGLLAIYQDHASLSLSATSLQTAYDRAAAHESYAVLTAQSECAKTVGANEALGKQNRDQQTLIAGCQQEAIKRLTPEPQKIFVLTLDENANQGNRESVYLLLTNKEVSPVRILAICDVPLDSVDSDPIWIGQYVGGATINNPGKSPIRYGQKPQRSVFSVEYTTPAWTPTTPIRVKMKYYSLNPAQCTFSLR